MRPTRAAMLVATSVAMALATASQKVLLVGNNNAMTHESADLEQVAFSPAGLVQLAVNSFGVPTSSLNVDDAVVSPVQADVFRRVNTYAMVMVNGASSTFLDDIKANVPTAVDAKQYDVDSPVEVVVPAVAAAEIKSNCDVDVKMACVGDAESCTHPLTNVEATSTFLDEVFEEAPFLNKENAKDLQFAKDLAELKQVTADIPSPASGSDTTNLPVVFHSFSFSSLAQLDSEKREDAEKLLVKLLGEYLLKISEIYPTASAQFVSQSASTPVQYVGEIASYGRMLQEESNSTDSEDDTTDITLESIAEYQIVLWTSLVLVFALLLVILSMCNLNPKRDSLLYAKFVTDGGHRKSD